MVTKNINQNIFIQSARNPSMGAYRCPDATGFRLSGCDGGIRTRCQRMILKAQLAQELAQVAMNRYPIRRTTRAQG